jgi:hypothetical protein
MASPVEPLGEYDAGREGEADHEQRVRAAGRHAVQFPALPTEQTP